MKRKDIVDIMKAYEDKTWFLGRLRSRIPYVRIGEPDTNSIEYEKWVESKQKFDEWLGEEIN